MIVYHESTKIWNHEILFSFLWLKFLFATVFFTTKNPKFSKGYSVILDVFLSDLRVLRG
jgi:hypothetical protein